MSTKPRFHVGDVVEYVPPENYQGEAPLGPFPIMSPPTLNFGILVYEYVRWFYPEPALRLVNNQCPVTVDIGELL